MHNNIKCNICNHNAILFKYNNISNISNKDIKITDSQYGKHWTLFKCQNCNLVFSSPLPSHTLLLELYSAMKDDDYIEEEAGRKKNFMRILKRIELFHPAKGSLLDVGAASGMLIEVAIKMGWNAEGIELSANLANKALQKYLKVYNTDLESFNSNTSYDVITAIDIIEHLYEPESLLTKSYHWLKNNGLICIVTPNINSFAAKIFKNKWWHFRPAHLYYFNIKSISYLLAKNNFNIIAIKPYVWHFSLSYLLSRFSINFKNKMFKNFILPLNLLDSIEVYATKK